MPSPAPFGWHVPTGTAQSTFNDTSSSFTAFTPGQKLWLSYFYNATRTTGASTCTVTAKINWYNSASTLISTTTGGTFAINGTTAWTMSSDDPHTAPASAVSGQVVITVTSSSNPIQYDVYVAKVRLGRSQLFSTLGAAIGPGGNVTGAVDGNGRALIDFTQGHLNNTLDNIGDGSTYARLPGANTSGTGTTRRALIDFTQGHSNKSLANVDSTQNTKLNGIATGATANNVTYSASAPTGGSSGDIWVYTGVTPNVSYVNIAGTWQISANYTTNTNQLTDGASLGTTAAWGSVSSRPTELTDGRVSAGLTSTGDLNRNMTSTTRINSGIMGHATGGTYTGDLNATHGADLASNVTNNNLDNIIDGATYARLPGVNTTGTGTARRALIDFTQGHTNKSLANVDSTASTKLGGIAAGATVGATIGPGGNVGGAVDGNGRAIIDFSQGHFNKSLSNVDTAQDSKLNGIAAGATVGATYGVNASGFGTLAGRSNVNPASSDVSALGSMPPTIPSDGFIFSSTTSTISISWATFTVFRSDGTSFTIATSGFGIGSLTSNNPYKLYLYCVDTGGSSNTVSPVTTGSTPPAGSPACLFGQLGDAGAAAVMFARGNTPLGSFRVATTSSGTGSGAGGGSLCLHPDMLIGDRRAGDLAVGDLVAGPTEGQTVQDIKRAACSEWFSIMVEGVEAARVTRAHLFYRADGETVAAEDIKLGDLLATDGDHVEVTGLGLGFEVADLVALDVGGDHLHYGGPFNLLMHNGTQKP